MPSPAGCSGWIWQHRAPVCLRGISSGCRAGGWDAGLTARSRTGASPAREPAEGRGRETGGDAPSEAVVRPWGCSHRWRFAQVSSVQDAAGQAPGLQWVPVEGLEGREGTRQRGTVQSEGPALAPGGLSPALRSLRQGTARVTMSTAAWRGEWAAPLAPAPPKGPVRACSPHSPPPPGSPAPLGPLPPAPR